ncbi:MAG: signal transduction histidine kinase, partial [Nitrospirae bacterium]|nr:signal transduction histidine kinase [Nitrospirota bacterium]
IHLAQIEEQTDRARNIVQSLLEFSRSGDFKKQALPLGNVIEDTLRLVRGQLPAGVTVQVDVPAGLSITADKQRIQQVFINLVKNAGQAIEGEGAISIKAWKHRAIDKTEDDTAIVNYLKYRGKCTLEVDTVDIEVHDTGQGIPHEDLSKIFDPFFTTKDVGKGSGLGLYIVHEIIEEHDGCIAVDSSPDRGTSFLLRLPA